MSATRAVAEFVAAPPPLPSGARAAATRSRTDTACAALLGTAAAEQVSSVVTQHAGAPAVWANAVRASASGIDDTAVWGAAGAVLWPALEAAGAPTDDDSLAEACCVGIAVGEALWRSGRYREADRGFDGTSVFGTIAAAAACARYLRLPADEVVAALGIAASGTGGLIANLGTGLEAVHAGFAASNGLRAVRLAQAGFRGAPDILEARQGFAEAYFGPNWVTADQLRAELDRAFGTGPRMRQYPCHVEGQDLVSALIAHSGAVHTVEVTGIAATSGAARYDVPATPAEARSSLRYVLALALVTGTVSQDGLNPTSADGTGAQAAMTRVRVNVMSRWDERLTTGEPPTMVLAPGGIPTSPPAPELATKWQRVCTELAKSGNQQTAERIAAIAGI
jgi:2-methylcitrate dehydratase PrpD